MPKSFDKIIFNIELNRKKAHTIFNRAKFINFNN